MSCILSKMMLSVKSTLLVYTLGVTLLPLAIMALFIYHMQTRIVKVADAQFESVAAAATEQVTRDMLGICTIVQKNRDESIKRNRTKIYLLLEKYGLPSLSKETFEIESVNLIEAKNQLKIKQRILCFGKTKLDLSAPNSEFTKDLMVLKNFTRTDYSILVKSNNDGDMMLVATTLNSSIEHPILYSYIPAKRSSGVSLIALSDVLQGRTHKGLMELNGVSMFVNIEPIFDEDQNVIGAILITVPQNIIPDIAKYMSGISIGEQGYVWVLEPEDSLKSILRISKDGKMNNLIMQFDENNSRRQAFLKVIEDSKKLSEGEIASFVYTQPKSDTQVQQKRVVTYTYFRPWNWIIGSTSYTQDFARGTKIVEQQAESVLKKLGYICVLILFPLLLLSYYFISKLNLSFKLLKSIGESLTSGNIYDANIKLTKHAPVVYKSHIKETYEQFVSVGQMSRNLSTLITQTHASINDLALNADGISTSAKSLEKIVSAQAFLIKDVWHTTKTIHNFAHRLNRQAASAAADVRRTLSNAAQSGADLASLRVNAEELVSATNEIVSALALINKNANKISFVISSIEDLSDKTNLLSYSASVEAEKAGELGLGFSIVAREIRKLAGKTATAAKDIEAMVKEMQSSVISGVMEMDRFGIRMRESSQTIQSATISLTSVVEQISNIAPQFETIAREIDKQSENAETISLTMDKVNSTSTKINERITVFKETTESIDQISLKLKEEISNFKTTEAEK